MSVLTHELSEMVGKAFADEGLPAEYGRVRVADRLAQFQCNGAMAAAKQAGKNPHDVAQKICDRLTGLSVFSKVDIAGPGFINLTLTDDFLSQHLQNIDDTKSDLSDDMKNVPAQPRYGVPRYSNFENVVIDYGGPNIAKAMHVGHLRAAIVGDSVRRIMKFAGYNALGDVHMGDWGTHMGILIADYIRRREDMNVITINLDRSDDILRLMEDMAERYPRAAAEAKDDPDLMRQAQETTVMLQNREEPYILLWQMIRDVSVIGMKRNYGLLGVYFDLWKGEADVHQYIAPMVEDLKTRGWAVESDGAWVFPVAQNDDKKEVPPLILYKRDGAVMYGTTDMATLVERMREYNPAKVVYVVDQRQSLHFEQVFRAARKGGIVPDGVELTHAGFGTMNGVDGKPFKTRAGGVMRLEDLIAMALEKARARMSEAHMAENMAASEREDVASKVAIAAIKFADLQNQRQSDYIFDLDRMTAFEGKTGPYLLYQAVRIKSLLKKADHPMVRSSDNLIIQDPDRPLALLLTQFPDAFDAALKHYAPHHLCDHAYRLAQQFSSFYNACHILSETDEGLKNSRLRLCNLTLTQMELTLALLGIGVPERM